jgi:hypothetical protein
MTGGKVWSDEEVCQILRNVGVDTECGACMCQAFTGSNGYEHTCGKESGITITSVEPERCGARAGLGFYTCELPKGHDGNHIAHGLIAECEWTNPGQTRYSDDSDD